MALDDLLGRAVIVGEFADEVAKAGSAVPARRQVMSVLRAIALTGPNPAYESGEDLARALREDHDLARVWRASRASRGNLAQAFTDLVSGRNNPERSHWEADLYMAFAKPAARALATRSAKDGVDPVRLLDVVRREYVSLEAALHAAFDFARAFLDVPTPMIDTAMAERPFWTLRVDADAPSVARDHAEDIRRIFIEGRERIVFLTGPAFGAKLEILKGVIQGLPSEYLETGELRLPIFAQALASWSTEVFIDRIFRFYAGAAVSRGVTAGLDLAAKLSFVRAATQVTPAFVVLADVEPFEEDALMRRLRGDPIGDIVDALIHGHEDSRLLIAFNTDSEKDDLPAAGVAPRIRVAASREEFEDALAASRLLPDTRPSKRPLGALTMRTAIPILRRYKDNPAVLKDRVEMVRSLIRHDRHRDLFDLFWNEVCTDVERLLLGLVASSHDGLRLATLIEVLKQLKGMDHQRKSRIALDKVLVTAKDLRAWQQGSAGVVRWRLDGDRDDTDTPGTFYIRDPFRSLVFEFWATSKETLWHDGVWCIAREAARQAREHSLQHGASAAAEALSRNMQALQGLLASIEPGKVAPPGGALPVASTLEPAVLPPLTRQRSKRPGATVSYRYAWSQLYLLDIDPGHDLINGHGDAEGRIDALLPFLKPDKPWRTSESRELAPPGEPITLGHLGPAQRGLTPHEQIDLLTRLATAALAAGRYQLVIDCHRLGRLVEDAHPEVLGPQDMFRLERAEIDLWILLGGAPQTRLPSSRAPTPDSAEDLRDRAHRLSGALSRIDRVAKRLLKRRGADKAFILGKLALRKAEVLHLLGDGDGEFAAMKVALEQERQTIRLLGPGVSAPLTAGYGIRRLIRYCLDRGLSRPFETLDFADGLAWPRVALPTASLMRRVEDLIAVNERRAIRGVRAARLAVSLDRCRFALAQRSFDEAHSSLEAGIRASARGSSAPDGLLEFSVLRLELDLETGMDHAWRVEQGEPMDTDFAELKERADAALGTLARLAGEELVVYSALHSYFSGQLEILASRLDPAADARLDHLRRARGALSEVVGDLSSEGIGLWTPRASATLAAVDAAITRHERSMSAGLPSALKRDAHVMLD